MSFWPYIAMAPYCYGPYSHGLYRYGLYSHGYVSIRRSVHTSLAVAFSRDFLASRDG